MNRGDGSRFFWGRSSRSQCATCDTLVIILSWQWAMSGGGCWLVWVPAYPQLTHEDMQCEQETSPVLEATEMWKLFAPVV